MVHPMSALLQCLHYFISWNQGFAQYSANKQVLFNLFSEWVLTCVIISAVMYIFRGMVSWEFFFTSTSVPCSHNQRDVPWLFTLDCVVYKCPVCPDARWLQGVCWPVRGRCEHRQDDSPWDTLSVRHWGENLLVVLLLAALSSGGRLAMVAVVFFLIFSFLAFLSLCSLTTFSISYFVLLFSVLPAFPDLS